MRARNIAAVALIFIGALGLGYGGFSYAGDAALHLSISEKEAIIVPVWAGAAGIVLMLVSRRRS